MKGLNRTTPPDLPSYMGPADHDGAGNPASCVLPVGTSRMAWSCTTFTQQP